MTRQEILTNIYHSEYVNRTLKTILKKSVGEAKYSHYYDDARSHFLQCISTVKDETLLEIHEEKGMKGVEYYCAGIINNQFASSTSSFYKQFRNPNLYTVPLWNVDNYRECAKDTDYPNVLSEQQDELIFKTLKILTDTSEEVLATQQEQWKIDNIKKIKALLSTLPKELGLHCKIMFELYYFKDLTYQKIEEISGVNYQTVRLYVQKTLNHLKKELKNDPKTNI